MQWLSTLEDDQMEADQKKAFDRAISKLGLEGEPAPHWLRRLAHSPEFVKDTYMNLARHVLESGALSAMIKLTIASAVASHAGQHELASFFARRAQAEGATRRSLYEAAGIAATSTAHNHYYKFRSLYQGDEFAGYSPGLRATLFVKPSQGKGFAELVNLVISSINGCSSCVNGHVAEALEHDVTREQIDEAVRTGAIVMSIATFAGA